MSPRYRSVARAHKMDTVLAAGVMLAGLLLQPQALPAQEAATEASGGTALTIYSTATPGAVPPELYRPEGGRGFAAQIPGYAVVKQERQLDLPQGVGTLRFIDVAARIDPTTVTFESLTDSAGTRVLDQSYQFDLVSTDKLLERYIDREITVEQAHGDRVETFKGKLLSTAGGIVLQTEGNVIVLSNYSNVRFGALPGGLITRPTLVWRVTAARPGPHRTRVTYQTDGITWWTDYNVVFTEGADANSGLLDVGAWVSIVNKSGATYADAKLKLIAGDVHRAPTPAPMVPKQMRVMAMAAPDMEAGFEEKAFFEYHLYTLGRPATLPDNSTQQIELFPTARAVKCEKVLVYYGLEQRFGRYGSPMIDRNFGVQSNKKVDTYLRFKNEKENGMGMPLPSGRIRVSKLDPADKTLEFIGEDKIDHTPRSEEVLIKLGSAFDVVGERRQVDFKVDSNRNWMDETIEIKLRNRKTEPVKVIAKENLYRWVNWEIREATHKHEKIDARTIHFPVELKPDEEAVIRYTVHYSW